MWCCCSVVIWWAGCRLTIRSVRSPRPCCSGYFTTLFLTFLLGSLLWLAMGLLICISCALSSLQGLALFLFDFLNGVSAHADVNRMTRSFYGPLHFFLFISLSVEFVLSELLFCVFTFFAVPQPQSVHRVFAQCSAARARNSAKHAAGPEELLVHCGLLDRGPK